jgi:hypothetical protein
MDTQLQQYHEHALAVMGTAEVLDAGQIAELMALSPSLAHAWRTRQRWRTETEMRVSVLNDVKHPTPASKFWQAVREQAVFVDQLLHLVYDYRKAVAEAEVHAARAEELEPEVNLQVSAYIPEQYMPDISQRYLTYRRMAALNARALARAGRRGLLDQRALQAEHECALRLDGAAARPQRPPQHGDQQRQKQQVEQRAPGQVEPAPQQHERLAQAPKERRRRRHRTTRLSAGLPRA